MASSSSTRFPLYVAIVAIVLGLVAVRTFPRTTADLQSPGPFPFNDVDEQSLQGQAAAYLNTKGVMTGLGDGTFGPYQTVNRAQMAKILMLASDKKVFNIINAGFFTDIGNGQWYTKYVLSAAMHEIISGYPDRSFRPAQAINTAEFLKMMTTTFGLKIFLAHSYQDVKTTDWFNQYAGIAPTYHLFPQRSNTYLEPARPMSRGEAAIAIYEFLQGGGAIPVTSSVASSVAVASSSSDGPPVLTISSRSASASHVSSSAAVVSSVGTSSVISASASSQRCYSPPIPPAGCVYICQQNVSCLREDQCVMICHSSSSAAHSLIFSSSSHS